MTNNPIAIIGEVLFDLFPDGRQILGGAPFNVAWHLEAFGQHPDFISRVGSDVMAQSIRSAMLAWGMDTANLQTDSKHPTGTVEVTICNGEPSYTILNNQAYDFIDARQLNPNQHYRIIYHGTLALRHRQTAQTVNTLKTRHTGKVFIDVNLREPWWQIEQVKQGLVTANWLKLNHDELMRLTPRQNTLQATMQRFMARYPLEILIVTCGDQGAIALTHSGEFIETVPRRNLTIVDTVGAGDAFSAVFLLGLQLDWPLPLIMNRAQDFASALLSRKGATVQDIGFYQPFIDQWH